MARGWISDDLPDNDWGDVQMDRGDSFDCTPSEWHYDEVRRPIGFMRTKLRVRVKAWMQPIVKTP